MAGAPTAILEHKATLGRSCFDIAEEKDGEICVPEDFEALPYHFWIATSGFVYMREK